MPIAPDAQLASQAAVLLCRKEMSCCVVHLCMIVLSRESARANLFVTCVKHSGLGKRHTTSVRRCVMVVSPGFHASGRYITSL